MDWQPIETAPRDGTVILGLTKSGHVKSYRWVSASECAAYESEFGFSDNPDDYIAGWGETDDPFDENAWPVQWQPFSAPQGHGG